MEDLDIPDALQVTFRWQDYRKWYNWKSYLGSEADLSRVAGDVANRIASSAIPSRKPGTANPLPVGEPGEGNKEPYLIGFDGNKAKRILGLDYRGMEETMRDILVECEQRGW